MNDDQQGSEGLGRVASDPTHPTTGNHVTLDSLERDVVRAFGEVAGAQPMRMLFGEGELVDEQFEVVRPLGRGGMGEVYVARDIQLSRLVALKTLKSSMRLNERKRARFAQLAERDAASTAQLNHPNIVTIFSFGLHEETPYLVLELVDGEPLHHALSRHGRMAELEVVELGLQLCDALAHAHDQGIVHRDIKPSNLMRTADGRLKVLDFGIALMHKATSELEDAFGVPPRQLAERLGEPMQAAGTMAYMAPEQYFGLLQDERVDVWAVGVTLHELLHGRPPCASPLEVIEQGDALWSADSFVSRPTREAIAACMTVDLGARVPSMRALSVLLEPALAALMTHERASARRSRTNIVVPMDAFFGRDDDLAKLDAMVFEQNTPLVVVDGFGGVGKTRLVTEWGRVALERGAVREVILCALSDARSVSEVLTSVCDALGASPAKRAHEGGLSALLDEETNGLVLILDGCEHLARDIAPVLVDQVSRPSSAHLVVTSRVALDIDGACSMRLKPLRDVGAAVTLYTERARQVVAGWRCPEGRKETLARLMEELDGLPLAIELAASRVRVLPPARMLARLDPCLNVLEPVRRVPSSRHTSLRRVLDQSWGALGEAERSVLARMSALGGDFTLEDVEELAEQLGVEEGDLRSVVRELLRVSLLERDGDRLEMLRIIRAYAADRR